jgi:BCD family chlorophyll transporter-like MFS transporter
MDGSTRAANAGPAMIPAQLGWLGIVRLGLVQSGLGAIVVLMTSVVNRVLVVELALPAVIPGALVALHYGVQILRPRWGYGSDVGGRRTIWIINGMAILACGGLGAACATALIASQPLAGLGLAVIAFILVGVGVGAAGTSLLTLLAGLVAPERRPAAATITWLMMITGIAITAYVAGQFLDPFSFVRLIAITAIVASFALFVTVVAVWKIEPTSAGAPARPNQKTSSQISSSQAPSSQTSASQTSASQASFREAFGQVWNEPQSRRFAIFVFVSMLAYSAQELLLEPFAGIVFRFTPGESTKLSSAQHGGVLVGMLLVAVTASLFAKRWFGSMRLWTFLGCVASAAMLFVIALGGVVDLPWSLQKSVFALGLANGTFAVSAIWAMMGLAGTDTAARAGLRIGLWGGAQAVAFGLGGFTGTLAADISRHLIQPPALAYGVVFIGQAGLFLIGGALALRLGAAPSRTREVILLTDPQLIAGPTEVEA